MSNTPNGATRQHRWSDNEIENLRQAGVRVANGQSTWVDEMVNMPAGVGLRNCRERFGRSFDHAGNARVQTATYPPYIPAKLFPFFAAPVVPANLPAILPASIQAAVSGAFIPVALPASVPVQLGTIADNIFYGGMAELEECVALADAKLLDMVSTFKIYEHKEDFEAMDLKFIVEMELLKLYETVAEVVEDLAECRVAVVEVEN